MIRGMIRGYDSRKSNFLPLLKTARIKKKQAHMIIYVCVCLYTLHMFFWTYYIPYAICSMVLEYLHIFTNICPNKITQSCRYTIHEAYGHWYTKWRFLVWWIVWTSPDVRGWDPRFLMGKKPHWNQQDQMQTAKTWTENTRMDTLI